MDSADSDFFFRYLGDDALGDGQALLFLAMAARQDWELLFSYTKSIEFTAGTVLIQQGDYDNALCLLADGELEVVGAKVQSGEPERLATIAAGTLIGEQSFIDGGVRSATVRALTAGRMHRLERSSFDVLAARNPKLANQILMDLARVLSLRLRQTSRQLVA